MVWEIESRSFAITRLAEVSGPGLHPRPVVVGPWVRITNRGFYGWEAPGVEPPDHAGMLGGVGRAGSNPAYPIILIIVETKGAGAARNNKSAILCLSDSMSQVMVLSPKGLVPFLLSRAVGFDQPYIM